MAKKQIKADKYECNACGRVEIIEKGEELPYGFHGARTFQISEYGGSASVEWYACSLDCIRSAVVNAISDSYGHES